MSATLPLEKMTVAEKLQAMEELWADLSRDENFESPSWHEEILKKRANEINFVDWETAKEKLRARLK
jgi:Putative addiction module component